MDETSTSYRQYLFVRVRQFQTIGKWTILLRMNIIAHFFLRSNGAPDVSQNAEVPCVPESSQVGASGSPTACHEDLDEDGASHVCSNLKLTSLTPVFKSFEDSVARMRPYIVLDGITSLNIITTLPFFKISFLERVTGWNPKRFPPTDPFRHQDNLVAKKVKAKQGETPQVSHVCTRSR